MGDVDFWRERIAFTSKLIASKFSRVDIMLNPYETCVSLSDPLDCSWNQAVWYASQVSKYKQDQHTARGYSSYSGIVKLINNMFACLVGKECFDLGCSSKKATSTSKKAMNISGQQSWDVQFPLCLFLCCGCGRGGGMVCATVTFILYLSKDQKILQD